MASPLRTATVMVAVAVVVSLVFSTTVLAIGVSRSTSLSAARFGADLMVLPPYTPGAYTNLNVSSPIFVVQASNQRLNGSVQLGIARIRGVDAVSAQLYVTTLNGYTPPLRLVAFDPQTDFTIQPWLPSDANTIMDSDTALAGSAIGLKIGDEVSWNGVSLKVVGVLESTNSSADNTLFFPINTAYQVAQNGSSQTEFTRGEVSGLIIKLAAGATLQDIEPGLRAWLSAYTTVQPVEVAHQAKVETAGIATYELLVAGVMGGAVIILIALLFSMTVNERKRQLGLLRSFGATKRFILRSVFMEVALMAFFGGLLGLAVGEMVLVLGENYVGSTFSITILPLSRLEMSILGVISVVAGVGIGSAGAAYPVFLATRLDPYDAIRKGE